LALVIFPSISRGKSRQRSLELVAFGLGQIGFLVLGKYVQQGHRNVGAAVKADNSEAAALAFSLAAEANLASTAGALDFITSNDGSAFRSMG
jgi:hypothetical protein